MNHRMPHRLIGLLALPCALGLGGCAGLDTVQPWEKGRLAHPGMGFDADPLDQRLLQHTYASKEAANGGYGVGGGGCGCN